VGGRTQWIVAAALVAPLVLLLFVAVRTWRAERRYGAVTRSAVQAYSSIAASQFARRANVMLQQEAMNAFMANGCPTCDEMRRTATQPFVPRTPGSFLPRAAEQKAPLLRHARLAFTFTLPDSSLATCCASDTATRALIWRALQRFDPRAPDATTTSRVFFDDRTSPHSAVALLTMSPTRTRMTVVYGIVADADPLRDRFAELARSALLLPGLDASRRLGPQDIGVRIVQDDGRLLYTFGRALGATAGIDSIGLQRSGLRVELDVSPKLASSLLAGGAPASQMPALLLTIAVAGALAVLGLIHERRSRELARLRARFVANVSHELRTPLAQISMFAETLELGRERSREEGRHFAAIIRAEARRLAALVENVLRFSRLESGSHALRLESHNVAEQVRAAVDSFQPIADAADVTLSVELEEDAHVLIDAAGFRQIMLNLLDNAVKHGGRGGRINVCSKRVGEEVQVSVEDAGVGIPRADRARVFEPYVRVEGRGAAGAGIGLAVVRDLISAHGGRVWIGDSPLGGARVTVAFRAEAQVVTRPAAVRPA
jgi:signal transduction histidine kinase